MGNVRMDESESLKAYNNIYLEIILRYKEYIEEKEGLYVADLPKLVTPNDESVLLLARQIKDGFPVYNYDDNFSDAARAAYQYAKDKIIDISLPIQFWLSPSQTIKYSAGDIFDKAVLLCSVLIALGNASSRIVVVVKDMERHFIVYSEFKDKIIGINMEKGVKDYANFEKLFKEINIGSSDETTAYEFNDNMYRDIL
jgi:hypothetical protein